MFKRKKKQTGCETPTYSRFSMAPEPTKSSKPNPNYVPPASVAKTKEKENMTVNTTMYGLKLYIPFEDLNAYIHEHIEAAHKDHTFIPVKTEVNELDLGIEISLISAVSNEFDSRDRYKLDLNKLPKENNKCKD
mgnify:CR=1 FL=1